tara:strand:+ start:267 stop:500 length:234 start_codon:yes stop_codon:yes gene_type:complete
MPLYRFKNKETEEEYDDMMSISDMEHFLQFNPNVSLVVSSPMIVSGVGLKTTSAFKETMQKIKSHHTVRGDMMDKWT